MPDLINSQSSSPFYPLLQALSDSLNANIESLDAIELENAFLVNNLSLIHI